MSQWNNGGTPPEKRGEYSVCILNTVDMFDCVNREKNK